MAPGEWRCGARGAIVLHIYCLRHYIKIGEFPFLAEINVDLVEKIKRETILSISETSCSPIVWPSLTEKTSFNHRGRPETNARQVKTDVTALVG